jgi:hypothetical protein
MIEALRELNKYRLKANEPLAKIVIRQNINQEWTSEGYQETLETHFLLAFSSQQTIYCGTTQEAAQKQIEDILATMKQNDASWKQYKSHMAAIGR